MKGKGKGQGWHDEPRRHGLARMGINTVLPDGRRLPVDRFIAMGKVKEFNVGGRYWSMEFNPDGKVNDIFDLSLGNMSDAGWYWTGSENELALFLTDRKSVVQGKSVDLGGRRIIKKKK